MQTKRFRPVGTYNRLGGSQDVFQQLGYRITPIFPCTNPDFFTNQVCKRIDLFGTVSDKTM